MAVGEFELFRTSEPNEGENKPRDGNSGFGGPWFHDRAGVPDPNEKGVVAEVWDGQ